MEDYKAIVGLFADIKVRESKKGTMFIRDQHNNAVGTAWPVRETDMWDFSPEPMDGLSADDLKVRTIQGRKSLYLYVMYLIQVNLTAGG
jgi:hypothetical protein